MQTTGKVAQSSSIYRSTADNLSLNQIIKLGSASVEKSQAGTVCHVNGIFQTICAGTHGYAIGYILE